MKKTANIQTFDINKLEELMKLGVKCNFIGLERYFHNPKQRILLIQVYNPFSMGGGIGFTVHTSNPKNDMLTSFSFVEERHWSNMNENNSGLSYSGDLKDFKRLSRFISETCSLPDMVLKV